MRKSEVGFLKQAHDAFGIGELLTTLVSTGTVIIAPIRMTQEWLRGAREFSSPVRVFVATVALTAVIVGLGLPPVMEWLVAGGANPSLSTIAFQWRGLLDPLFHAGFEESLSNPIQHLLRVRQIHNLVVFPYQAIVTTFALWLVFRRNQKLRLSKEEARAVALYVTAGVYLQSFIVFSLGYLLDSFLLVGLTALYGWVATIVGFGMAVSRVKEATGVSIYLGCLVAYVVALVLYFPVAFACDVLALYPNPLFDVF